MRRVIAAAAAGTAFEWYDFFIFGAMASVLAANFFAALPENQAFVMTLATFAAGFIARPFGALVFGRIGDARGRKGAFLYTIVIMGVATFATGLLPTYADVGLAAPVGLVLLRIVQGFALGGEYGGAAIFVAEHSAPHRRGRDTGWIQTSAALGLIMALSVILIVRNILGEDAFSAWGWRIPFLLSAVLIAISIWIRLSLHESPVFQQMRAEGRVGTAPLRQTFLNRRNLGLVILALFGVMMAQSVVYYTGYFYAQYFLERVLRVSGPTVTAIMLTVSVISAFLYVAFAWLSDHVGRKPLMLFGMALALIAYFPGFQALTQAANPRLAEARGSVAVTLYADPAECALQLDILGAARFASSCDIARAALAAHAVRFETQPRAGRAAIHIGDVALAAPDAHGLSTTALRTTQDDFRTRLRAALRTAGYPDGAAQAEVNVPLAIAIVTLFIVAATAMYGPLAAFLVELFPAQIRYTALSFPYHVGSGWFGGLMPAIAFAIMTATGNIYAGLWYPFTITAIAFVIMIVLAPETRGRPIDA
ncbi:MAG: MFS transporter [Alphaproteobacteria bacterium]|nr:MFS transporter [Alphaproteobacteria bacterium]